MPRRGPITYTGLGGCIAQGLDCVLAALAHGDRPESLLTQICKCLFGSAVLSTCIAVGSQLFLTWQID